MGERAQITRDAGGDTAADLIIECSSTNSNDNNDTVVDSHRYSFSTSDITQSTGGGHSVESKFSLLHGVIFTHVGLNE